MLRLASPYLPTITPGSTDGPPPPARRRRSRRRTVTDTFSNVQVQVPAKPERVVALWRTGAVLADIGVTPAGQLDGEILPEELGTEKVAELGSIPSVGTFEGVDVEKVLALKPDLIIGMDNGGLKIDYKELRDVAPTVILRIKEPTDVWDNYPKVAEIVGRSTDYATRNKELSDRLATIKSTYGSAVGSLSATAISTYETSIFVDTAKSLTYRRIDGAGFGYNKRYATNPERYVAELSAENLPSLDDQNVLFYEVDITGKPTPDTQKLLDSASFKRLAAARAGRVFPLTSGVVYTFAAGQKQADDLEAAAKKLAA